MQQVTRISLQFGECFLEIETHKARPRNVLTTSDPLIPLTLNVFIINRIGPEDGTDQLVEKLKEKHWWVSLFVYRQDGFAGCQTSTVDLQSKCGPHLPSHTGMA